MSHSPSYSCHLSVLSSIFPSFPSLIKREVAALLTQPLACFLPPFKRNDSPREPNPFAHTTFLFRFAHEAQCSHLTDTSQNLIIQTRVQGSVVWRPISANPSLNLNQAFFISMFKCLFWIILSVLFRASNNQILDKKNNITFSFKASRNEVRFHTNPGLSWTTQLRAPTF